MSRSIKGHTFSYLDSYIICFFCIHLFILRLRETEFCTVRVRQPTKKVLSYCWEIISSWEMNCQLSRSTTARAIFVLRRLRPTQDLIYTQVPTDCFYFGFHAIWFLMQTIPHTALFISFALFILFYSTDLPNNLKTNMFFVFSIFT